MKQRDLPVWLAGDVIAFVGVLSSFFSLVARFVPAVVRMLKEKRRGFSEAELQAWERQVRASIAYSNERSS